MYSQFSCVKDVFFHDYNVVLFFRNKIFEIYLTRFFLNMFSTNRYFTVSNIICLRGLKFQQS